LFNAIWLENKLDSFAAASAADVQATLTEFTACACVSDVRRYAPEATELMVCGGGALNAWLMTRLQSGLPHLKVLSTAERGLPPQQVEATAFAWLARQTMRRLPGNSPKVTGAQGARIVGGVFPA
jgi:anhydro-N-acetylmuramic acid kinase